MAITMRNYKRHLGVLLSTHWDIRELEMGVYEKEYDPNTGEYYMERKIIKLNPTGFIDIQWIQERTKVEEMVQQVVDEVMQNEVDRRDDTGAAEEEQMP